MVVTNLKHILAIASAALHGAHAKTGGLSTIALARAPMVASGIVTGVLTLDHLLHDGFFSHVMSNAGHTLQDALSHLSPFGNAYAEDVPAGTPGTFALVSDRPINTEDFSLVGYRHVRDASGNYSEIPDITIPYSTDPIPGNKVQVNVPHYDADDIYKYGLILKDCSGSRHITILDMDLVAGHLRVTGPMACPASDRANGLRGGLAMVSLVAGYMLSETLRGRYFKHKRLK